MNEKELLKKKQEIQEIKTELSENKGAEKTLMKQLKTEFGISTLSEAKLKLEEFNKKLEKYNNRIETSTKELVETYFEEEE